MATDINDPELEAKLRARRKRIGADRRDEVWEGVDFMSPQANNEHQFLVTRLSTLLDLAVGLRGLGIVQSGANISDREVGWRQNYRVPDVVVYLNGNPARNRDTHWLGGPDLAVEVVSQGDRTLEKLDFHAKVNTRELLIVHREPWRLDLYKLRGGFLVQDGTSTLEQPDTIASEVVPLSFRLEPGEARPILVVEHQDGDQNWRISLKMEEAQ